MILEHRTDALQAGRLRAYFTTDEGTVNEIVHVSAMTNKILVPTPFSPTK